MSSINLTGTIQYTEIGTGAWGLVTDVGETYELYESPPELQIPQMKVKVEGAIRDDIMTLAMIGPVLEVQSFEILD